MVGRTVYEKRSGAMAEEREERYIRSVQETRNAWSDIVPNVYRPVSTTFEAIADHTFLFSCSDRTVVSSLLRHRPRTFFTDVRRTIKVTLGWGELWKFG